MARVMVVDDENALLELIAAFIEELGHEATTATDGRDALNALQDSEPPTLIISDIMMPRMSGVELAETLKADPFFCDVPIILMSAAGQPPSDHVADHFIPKPFNLDLLALLISQYGDRERERGG